MLSPVAAAVGLEALYLGVGAACALFFVLFLTLFRQKTA
jgi:hypothetical protein